MTFTHASKARNPFRCFLPIPIYFQLKVCFGQNHLSSPRNFVTLGQVACLRGQGNIALQCLSKIISLEFRQSNFH